MKRLLAMFLAVVMILSCLPMTIFAAEETTPEIIGEEPAVKAGVVYNTIAEAKAYTDTSTVYTLKGIVTYISGKTVYIEDETGGICVYFATGAVPPELALGDELAVTDTMTAYKGLIETTNTTAEEVQILSSGNALPNQNVTLAQILADKSNEYLSERVTVTGLTMGTINPSGSTTLTDAEGNTIALYKASGLSADINEGDVVSMTCIVSTFNGYQFIVNPGTAATDVVETSAGEAEEAVTVTIAEAKAGTNGEYYQVEGIATYVDGRNVYIQDETGGIVIYLNSAATNTNVGDKIRVRGARAVFNGLIELSGIVETDAEFYEILSSDNTVEPQQISLAQLLADTNNEYLAELVAITDTLTITDVGEYDADFQDITYNVSDGDHSISLDRVFAATEADVLSVGTQIKVQAIVHTYNGYELRLVEMKVQDGSDPEPEPEPEPGVTYNTIAEAKAYTDTAAVYTLKGIVTYISGKTVYIEDETGGICVYFATGAVPPELALGDELVVTDTMTAYKGLIETTNTTAEEVQILSSGNALPNQNVTLAQILADTSNEYLSERVTVTGLTMGTINPSGSTTLTDAEGNTIALYKASGLSADINEGDVVSMTCIVSTFNGYQLIVNPGTAATDMVETSAGEEEEVVTVFIADAKAGTNGEYYQVEGIVTFIDGRNVYIQDPTGGIVIYLNAAATNTCVGDRVRARGARTTFNGLIELGGIVETDAEFYEILSNHNEYSFQEISLAQLLADTENEYLAEAVFLEDLTVVEVGEYDATYQNINYVVSDGVNTITLYRVPTETEADIIPLNTTIDVWAVVTTYNGYQLRVLSWSIHDDGPSEEYIILEIPAIEDMTQLLLEEEAVVQWTEEDFGSGNYKWFYFTPEVDMEITFVTTVDVNYDDLPDPKAYWTDAEGRVIVYNDDNNDRNSAIYVDAAAGETYFFAVESINANTGPLPVVILQGDQTGGGPGGGDYDDAFTENAPALEDMTVLELNTDYTAELSWENKFAWFTFTPEKDGFYSFYSDRGDSPLDPRAYMLNADLEILTSNDDGAGNLNFTIGEFLTAGVTYVFAVSDWNELNGHYTVRIAERVEVTGISVAPISIPEGSWCTYEYVMTEDGFETIPHYYFGEVMEVTLTFSDGGTVSGTGSWFSYNGSGYSVGYSVDDFSGTWEEGVVVPITVYGDDDVKTETTITLTKSPIKSVSFDDVVILEETNGYYSEEYDEETGEYTYQYIYDWVSCLSWTVTMNNGKKVSGTGNEVRYDGNTYVIGGIDHQHAGEPFVAGNTYTVNAQVGNVVAPVDVIVRDVVEELPQVENPRVTSIGETSAKIAFDKVKGADRYEIYVNGSYWGSTTKTSYTLKGLTCGGYYWIRVAAAKKVDGKYVCGPHSAEVYVMPCKDISDCYISMKEDTFIYDGVSKYPEVVVKTSSKGRTMILNEEYGLYYDSNNTVGTGYVIVYGMGLYGNNVIKRFKILPQQVTGVEVTEITHNSATITFDPVVGATEYWIYNGSKRVAKTEDTSYTITGLSAGKTYKFSVKANTVVETPLYNENGEFVEMKQDDYTGKASATVSAKPVYSMEECSVTVKYLSKTYTGKKVTNTFTVKNPNGKTLKKDTDYTVSYENNVEIGVATATLKGKGKYAGQISCVFFIGPKAVKDVEVDVLDGNSIEVSFDEMKGVDGYLVFVNGIQHSFTTEDEVVVDGLTAGQKYSITVSAALELDNGMLVPGAQSKAVSVTPKHNLLDYITGAYVHFDDGEFWTCNYTGKKVTPAVDVWVNHGNGEEMLVPGEDFVVEFKNNKNVGEATFTIKGTGAYYGSMKKQEFYIIPATVTNLRVKDSTETSVTLGWTKGKGAAYYEVFVDGYNVGKTTGSSFKVKNLVAGEEHYFSVVACKKVSKQGVYASDWVTISGRAGKYIGDMKISLEYTEIAWTGEPNTPAVTVKTSSKSSATTLVEGVDYTVTYVAVVGPGEAGVVIEGIGEYTGTVSKTFDIVPPQVENVFAQAVTNTKMEVVWNEVPGATEYWVYVNGSRKAKVSDTVCTISGLKKGRTYKVTVKAVAEVDGEDFVGAASEVEQCYMGVKA